ncbi:MAG TPA: HAMP domain-containing sensor histidine kinase, partial [bacterium]|nr:HAMP domain-containing sensor histidine kinase [bacterium]
MNLKRFAKRRISRKQSIADSKNINEFLTPLNFKLRILVNFSIVLIYFFINKYNYIDPIAENELIFYLSLFLLIGFNYYLFYIIKSGQSPKNVDFVIIGFDLTITTLLILSVGGVNSPYFILFYLILLNVNIKFDSAVSLTVTLISIVIYLCAAGYSYSKLIVPQNQIEHIFKIVSLIIYYLTFEWSRQLKKKTWTLNAKIADHNNELKIINEKLDSQKKELDQKNKYYLDMLNFVSHELKTPLTPITSISAYHMSEDEIVVEEARNSFAIIYNNAQNLKNMIEKFLGLSKIEKGEMIIEYRRMELINDIIVPIIMDLSRVAQEKGMKLVKGLGANDDSVTTYTDPQLIIVVFNNLFSNAIKYGDPNTEITYNVKVIDKQIKCSISNFGDGIPEDKLKTVFEKFERLDSVKGKIPGTGLGLFVTREIIEKLGGKIWCESKQNGLTVFTFVLPNEKDEIDEKDFFEE